MNFLNFYKLIEWEFFRKKMLLFYVLFLPFLSALKAQENVTHRGELIKISNGQDIYLFGSFKSDSTVTSVTKDLFINQGTIHLQGDLTNKGTLHIFGTPTDSLGTLRFFGGTPSTNARILGTQPINLTNLIIDLTDTALLGNVLLRTDSINAYGNVNFLNGGFDLDTNALFLRHISSYTSAKILNESNTARPLILTDNSQGKISVLNFPWSSTATYSNIKGIGLGFDRLDPLSSGTKLSRTFQSQACGDSVGHVGSISKVFSIENNLNNTRFQNTKIKFLNVSELAGNPFADSLRIFVSLDKGWVWNQHLNSSSLANITSSIEEAIFSTSSPQKYSVITAASPCSVNSPIQINQILTSVTPDDTLFNVSTVIACDPLGVSARLYASGEPGAVFEWRSSTGAYQRQSNLGYYEALSLGTFWVRMSTVRGCIDSVSINVVTAPQGNSAMNAIPNQICLGDTISPIPVLVNPSSTYLWSFGDTTTSSLINPSHIYLNRGTYPITLKVTTIDGCVSDSTRNIVINAIPVANFAAGSVCPGKDLNFDNNSSVLSGLTTVKLYWDFGDLTQDSTIGNISGSFGTGDIVHNYSTEGAYIVSLIAKANGCVSTSFVDTITIHPIPQALFSFGPTCEGQNVSFTNNSSISDLSVLAYSWDFTGAGPISSTTDPIYVYSANGSYSPQLIVTSSNGCADTLIQTITINQTPNVNFTSNNVCVNSLASFSDLSTLGTAPYSYLWNFGDGSFGIQMNDTNTYSMAGNYPVKLIVTTADGCKDSLVQNLTVFPGPTVSFSALNSCINSPITFLNTSSNAVSYLWNFPSLSQNSTQINPIQTYTASGKFPVILTATSSNLCQGTYLDSITIFPLPTLNLGSAITTCGSSYLLNANPGGVNNGSNFTWSTGSTSAQINPNYNGNFSVTVQSPQGCSFSDTVSLTLNAAVMPPLGPDATFCDSTLLDAGYPGATYLWNTGATTQTISVLTSGVYSVTVTDLNNCSGSDTISITLVTGLSVALGPDITACASNGVLLNAGLASSYLWSNGSTAPTLQVPTSGYYWVRTENGVGCSASDTIQVTLNASPVFSLGANTTACNQLVLNAFTPNASYAWNTSATSPSITVFNSGIFTVQVTDNITTCSASDTIDVIINALPIVNLGADTILCSYQSIVLNAANFGSTYSWNSGQNSQTISVATAGTYDVTVTDNNGCIGSDQVLVQILPVFQIDLGPDKQFCPGSTITLDAGLSPIGNTYLWKNSTGMLSATPTILVTDTGMHYLTVTNINSCIAKDSVVILPSNNSLFAVFLADSEIDKGDSLVFINLSHPRPYTSSWYLDNILVSTDSTPTISFTMPITPPLDTILTTLKISNAFCTSSVTKPILVRAGQRELPEPEPEPILKLFSEIKNMNLYPNPNNGMFNLSIEITRETYGVITIYNLVGELVHSENRFITTGIIPYSFEQFTPGMYFFTIQLFNEKRTLKFIKTQN